MMGSAQLKKLLIITVEIYQCLKNYTREFLKQSNPSEVKSYFHLRNTTIDQYLRQAEHTELYNCIHR